MALRSALLQIIQPFYHFDCEDIALLNAVDISATRRIDLCKFKIRNFL